MASSSGNVRLNTASKTTSGSRKSVQKANEQAPWKNSRKTSRDNQEYTNKFNKASLDNSISATNGVGFLNEWKWSASGTLRQAGLIECFLFYVKFELIIRKKCIHFLQIHVISVNFIIIYVILYSFQSKVLDYIKELYAKLIF